LPGLDDAKRIVFVELDDPARLPQTRHGVHADLEHLGSEIGPIVDEEELVGAQLARNQAERVVDHGFESQAFQSFPGLCLERGVAPHAVQLAIDDRTDEPARLPGRDPHVVVQERQLGHRLAWKRPELLAKIFDAEAQVRNRFDGLGGFLDREQCRQGKATQSGAAVQLGSSPFRGLWREGRSPQQAIHEAGRQIQLQRTAAAQCRGHVPERVGPQHDGFLEPVGRDPRSLAAVGVDHPLDRPGYRLASHERLRIRTAPVATTGRQQPLEEFRSVLRDNRRPRQELTRVRPDGRLDRSEQSPVERCHVLRDRATTRVTTPIRFGVATFLEPPHLDAFDGQVQARTRCRVPLGALVDDVQNELLGPCGS